jgi:hypothetical protein
MKKIITLVISGLFLISVAGCSTYGTKTTTTTKKVVGTNQGITQYKTDYGRRTGINYNANNILKYPQTSFKANRYGLNTGTNYGTMQGITTSQGIIKKTTGAVTNLKKKVITTKPVLTKKAAKKTTVVKKITTSKKGNTTTITTTITETVVNKK